MEYKVPAISTNSRTNSSATHATLDRMMIGAFPDYPIQPKAEVEVFYNHFGIDTK